MVRNITLSMDEDVIHRARVLAAQRGMSISALLRAELARLVNDENRFVSAREAALRRLKVGAHLGGSSLPSREEVHDRAGLR